MKFTISGLCYFQRIFKKASHTHRDSFLHFCLHMGYSPFPATSDIICQYATFLVRTLKVSSIRNYFHIIGLLHKEFGLKNPSADNWVLDTLIKGMKRAKGDAVKQKLPITVDLLFSIWHLLNFWSSFDSVFWAICLTAFFWYV